MGIDHIAITEQALPGCLLYFGAKAHSHVVPALLNLDTAQWKSMMKATHASVPTEPHLGTASLHFMQQ